MIKAVSPNGEITTYEYDYSGILQQFVHAGVVTKLIVDPLSPAGWPEVVAEETSGAVTRFTFGRELIAVGMGSTVRFVHQDVLGRLVCLTDAAGNVTDTYQYSPQGQLLDHNGDSPNTNLFAGERFDPSSQFYILVAFYDPASGRFTRRIQPMARIECLYRSTSTFTHMLIQPTMLIHPGGFH